ncbi:MAG TPA: hypothetical protein VHC20_07575 [Candidatus Paceibacterota bacterium]|nr:hypothetical protein [Candidatus Paceibacterota bacterium]
MTAPDQRVSRRLRARMQIFLAIGAVILAFIAHDVFDRVLPFWLAAVALLIGGALGYVLGRIRTVKRHETTNEIVSEMDLIGGAAIAAYVVFDLSREWIFGHFIQGPALSAFTLAILSGALFGRFFGLRVSINRILASGG